MAPSFLLSSLYNATYPLGWVVSLVNERNTVKSSVKPLINRPTASSPSHPPASPSVDILTHIGMNLACIPRLIIAWWWWNRMMTNDWGVYAQTLSWQWVLPILFRDLSVCWIAAGCTDLLTLHPSSPFYSAMAPRKYNTTYPKLFVRNQTAPIVRDMALSSLSCVVAAAIEVGVIHLYAIGYLSYSAEVWWKHWPTVLLMFTWFHTQNIQFYMMHRAMHKWGIPSSPSWDPGSWLYKHVHSWHHVSSEYF